MAIVNQTAPVETLLHDFVVFVFDKNILSV